MGSGEARRALGTIPIDRFAAWLRRPKKNHCRFCGIELEDSSARQCEGDAVVDCMAFFAW